MNEGKSKMWMKVAMSVREAISVIAGPREWGATRDSWLAGAARKTKTISVRMMRSLWNDEIKAEDHWAKRELIQQATIIEARREAQQLAANYEQIARGLNATDTDFYSADVAALVHAARILRDLASS
jgi:hypothetical protein